MKELLRDTRVQRLLIANTLGSIGSGITIFSVPWLLVHQPGGSEAYRWATIGTTIVLFIAVPVLAFAGDMQTRTAARTGDSPVTAWQVTRPAVVTR